MENNGIFYKIVKSSKIRPLFFATLVVEFSKVGKSRNKLQENISKTDILFLTATKLQPNLKFRNLVKRCKAEKPL